MMDNQSFTSHLENRENPSITSLITLERSQKLDLLIHLISNLKQSLIISGPHGIGKTTLLTELIMLKNDEWPIISIATSSNMSFESFQVQLLQQLIQNYIELEQHELSSILSTLDKQNQKVVAIVDNAGSLFPGLINTLIEYASEIECLRIVFALTQDELHIKNSTDHEIKDCHIIDIPPLTERQCGIFLQNLSAQPNAVLSFDAINNRLIEKIYRETHGIPGNIISELPRLSNANLHKSGAFKWASVAFITALITIGVSFLISNQPTVKQKKEEKIIPTHPLAQQKNEIIEPWSSEIATVEVNLANKLALENILEQPPEAATIKSENEIKIPQPSVIGKKPVDTTVNSELGVIADTAIIENEIIPKEQAVEKVVVEAKPATQDVSIKNDIVETKNKNQVEPKQAPIPEKENKNNVIKLEKQVSLEKTDRKKLETQAATNMGYDDSLWILGQPQNDYTIQLIILSNRQSVTKFLANNQNIKKNIKFFQLNNKQNKGKYVLIYGTFKNFSSATKKMNSLPAKFKGAWVRKFALLQKKITNKK